MDIRLRLPDGARHRLRCRAPISAKVAAQRWAEARERTWYDELTRPQPEATRKEVPTLAEFWPRFMEGHAHANRQKPSGIAAKETIARVHLIPALGGQRLDAISTERVQRVKAVLATRSTKTVNNVLTVLNTLLKKAVEWDVLDRMPCVIRLLRATKPAARSHDFTEYERLVEAATAEDRQALIVVLLGGDAGLRYGEMMALERDDVDFPKQRICVQRSDWKGHVTVPKGGRLRYVPMTVRLRAALRDHRHLRGKRVLCRPDGAPLTQKIVQDYVRRAAQKAGVKNGVHLLRHHADNRIMPSMLFDGLGCPGDERRVVCCEVGIIGVFSSAANLGEKERGHAGSIPEGRCRSGAHAGVATRRAARLVRCGSVGARLCASLHP